MQELMRYISRNEITKYGLLYPFSRLSAKNSEFNIEFNDLQKKFGMNLEIHTPKKMMFAYVGCWLLSIAQFVFGTQNYVGN